MKSAANSFSICTGTSDMKLYTTKASMSVDPYSALGAWIERIDALPGSTKLERAALR